MREYTSMKTYDMLVLMRVLYRQGLPVWESMAPVELAKVDAAAQAILSGKPVPEPEQKSARHIELERIKRDVMKRYIRGHIAEEDIEQQLAELDNQMWAEAER